MRLQFHRIVGSRDRCIRRKRREWKAIGARDAGVAVVRSRGVRAEEEIDVTADDGRIEVAGRGDRDSPLAVREGELARKRWSGGGLRFRGHRAESR